ncbi:NF-X1-type zinc finger protein NFXL1 [Anopheles darlingi]|uniref:NF-X1-type zinc finger protein NFXL1 n=1 Tax=Anopheles darlingi TaxID=43151 RepID=UPI0021005687|nr:NF-X1-type zinc finger protein NFXL1 [Anopheles darlingi]
MAYRDRKLAAPKVANAWRLPTPPPQPGGQRKPGTSNARTEDRMAGSKIPQPKTPSSTAAATTTTAMKKSAQEKFNQVQRQHVEKARQYATEYVSSEEEEDDADAGNTRLDGIGRNDGSSTQNILGSVLKNYNGAPSDMGKTQEYLQNLLESRNAVCLICIGTVKRADKIWSCQSCYTFFHLLCIQRWANDRISMKRMHHEEQEGYYNNRGEYIPKPVLSVHWDCPKCRQEYEPVDIPRHYECFCGKEQDPAQHPWLIPHSCGEPCGKQLKPTCGHHCRLLCHPGPCPPCPQTISVSCRCAKSAAKTIRCSQGSWTCTVKCTRKLDCGIHECTERCHPTGECPPCRNRSKQPCLCGAQSKEVNCFESRWQCEKVCNRPYACSLHKCELRCHAGPCGECPLGKPRSCPCGRTQTRAACSERIGTCGDTCQKMLACGVHQCMERCHEGECGSCLVLVQKTCRCGQTSREIPCSKEATCETKCKKVRRCGRHPCNRKCCDGQCPDCDKVCGKTLSCGRHKCSSCCHQGACYPCNQKSTVKCRCGGTSTEVACGREKKAHAPKCTLPCRQPAKCHHHNPHACHAGECPPCVQPCGEQNDTTNCEHPCEAKCHDAVTVVTKDKHFKPVGPWDVPRETVEVKRLPHPVCEVKVPVMCLGGHETSEWPCYNSKPASCGRPCGRLLKCGLHRCPLQCHKVTHRASTTQDSRCEPCAAGCVVPRPAGCVHPCKRRCHQNPCEPCMVSIKDKCYCGLTQVFYTCNDLYPPVEGGTDELQGRRNAVLSCGQKCIKNLSCGHRCTSVCHPGACPNPELCTKKVKVTCPCNHRKAELPCNVAKESGGALECDDGCEAIRIQRQQEEQAKEDERRAQEELANQRELEEYERKFNRRKHRERKRHEVKEQESRNLLLYILPALIVLVGVILYFVLLQ